jgi:protein AaeX
MSVTEVASRRGKTADDRDAIPSLQPEFRRPARRRMRIIPFLITLATVALAELLGWAMRDIYTIALRRVARRCGLLRCVWHRALFVFAAYIIVLSSWVLIVARSSS